MYTALGLYIHFPFCVRKCAYCDFLSAPGGDAMKRAYTDALVREIRAWKKVPTVPVDTICSASWMQSGTVLRSSLMPRSLWK